MRTMYVGSERLSDFFVAQNGKMFFKSFYSNFLAFLNVLGAAHAILMSLKPRTPLSPMYP